MRIETHIDDTFRERADDPERLEEARAEKREDLETLRESLADDRKELDVTRLGRVLNRSSEYAKLAADDDEALRHGREALEIWESLGRDKAAYLARLRCAEIRFFRGETSEALETLDEMVERADDESLEIYRDFALALRGRCQCACGRCGAGRRDLEEALEIRRERGNDQLVRQVRRVMELIE